MTTNPVTTRLARFTQAQATLAAATEKAVALIKALRPEPGTVVAQHNAMTQADARAMDDATAAMLADAAALENAVDEASLGLLPTDRPKEDKAKDDKADSRSKAHAPGA